MEEEEERLQEQRKEIYVHARQFGLRARFHRFVVVVVGLSAAGARQCESPGEILRIFYHSFYSNLGTCGRLLMEIDLPKEESENLI